MFFRLAAWFRVGNLVSGVEFVIAVVDDSVEGSGFGVDFDANEDMLCCLFYILQCLQL